MKGKSPRLQMRIKSLMNITDLQREGVIQEHIQECFEKFRNDFKIWYEIKFPKKVQIRISNDLKKDNQKEKSHLKNQKETKSFREIFNINEKLGNQIKPSFAFIPTTEKMEKLIKKAMRKSKK